MRTEARDEFGRRKEERSSRRAQEAYSSAGVRRLCYLRMLVQA